MLYFNFRICNSERDGSYTHPCQNLQSGRVVELLNSVLSVINKFRPLLGARKLLGTPCPPTPFLMLGVSRSTYVTITLPCPMSLPCSLTCHAPWTGGNRPLEPQRQNLQPIRQKQDSGRFSREAGVRKRDRLCDSVADGLECFILPLSREKEHGRSIRKCWPGQLE